MKTLKHSAKHSATHSAAYSACLALLLFACSDAQGPTVAVTGQVIAGPTCPVESVEPDPSCEPRMVADAEMVVLDPDGAEVASVVTGADGTFTIDLPAGNYTLVPQPVEGLMGTASPVNLSVGEAPLELERISYDTGIR